RDPNARSTAGRPTRFVTTTHVVHAHGAAGKHRDPHRRGLALTRERGAARIGSPPFADRADEVPQISLGASAFHYCDPAWCLPDVAYTTVCRPRRGAVLSVGDRTPGESLFAGTL